MSTIAWPSGRAFIPNTAQHRQHHNNQVSVSPLNGFTQTASLPGMRWGWAMDWVTIRNGDRPDIEAFVTSLSGREDRVQIYDFQNPTPRGNCNLSGVTVQSTAAAFAKSIALAGCGAGKTLKARDWVGLPTGQLVMVVSDAVANGSGVMTLNIRPMLRSTVLSGGPVTLNSPTALYILTESSISLPRSPGMANPNLAGPGFSLEFVESFA